AFTRKAALRSGLSGTFVQSSVVIDDPRSVRSVMVKTASAANGFMTMRYASSCCLVVPSARSHLVAGRARQGSAATPTSPPPACATHPAATHPPKYSTELEDSRCGAGSGRARSLPGGTVNDLGRLGAPADSSVTRIRTGRSPGLAT